MCLYVADWAIYAEATSCQKIEYLMSNFASRYSKDTVTKKEGRGQLPVMSKEGKEELELLIKAVATTMKLDVSDYGDFSLLSHFYLGCPKYNIPQGF